MYKTRFDIAEDKIIPHMPPYTVPFSHNVVTYPPDSPLPEKEQVLHFHGEVEIHYVLKGHGLSIINNVPFHTAPGDIVFVNPNVLHVNRLGREEVVTYRLMINDEYCKEMHLDLEQEPIKPLIRDRRAEAIVREMYEETRRIQKHYFIECFAGTLRLLVYLARNHAQENADHVFNQPQSSKHLLAKRAIRYMEAHFTEPLSLGELAESLGYSRYYFSHTFTEIVGCTAVHYLNLLRCNYAGILLANEDYNVSQIASLCGFTNSSYFTQTYKRLKGRLPSSDKLYQARPIDR